MAAISDVGWPIPTSLTRHVIRATPYIDTYRIEPMPYAFAHRDKAFVIPYGYTYFANQPATGTSVDAWA